jgi:small subunit ribosomal protein S16
VKNAKIFLTRVIRPLEKSQLEEIMALKIRLQKNGRRHRPLYRIVVAEASARRDGKFVEVLGNYNPSPQGKEEPLTARLERIDYWIGVGAQPTDTVRGLIRQVRALKKISRESSAAAV